MEEGEFGVQQVEEPMPPPPPEETGGAGVPGETGDIRVNVIKPFKPSPRITRFMWQGKCYYHPTKPASFICTSCSRQICATCATNIGEIYYCPQCSPPPPTATIATAPRTQENKSWYKALFAIGLIVLIIGALFAGLYWPLSSIDAAKFENIVNKYYDEGGHNFEDYKPGDIITIRDTIKRIDTDYDPSYGVVTLLWFESTGKDDLDFTMEFDADLEQDYNVGDSVFITLHVDEDSRTRNEVIEEQYNNLPNISNIDHTVSVDIIFFALIVFGVLLVLIALLFMQKLKREELQESYSGTEPPPMEYPPPPEEIPK